MAKDEPQELTQEEALIRAQEMADNGILAQMGIKIDTPDQIAVRLAQALVDAPDIESLLDESGTTGWAEHEGRSVLIRHVSYAPSAKKSALGFYAIVDAVDVDSNKPLVLTSGGQNVVVQLAKMVKMNALDTPVKLKVDTTAEGNRIHRLVKGDVGSNAPF